MTDPTANSTTVSAPRAGLQVPFGRRGWLLIAGVVIVSGSALNWGWLTAVGLAPLLIAIAPCAVMCGLGLCMMGGGKKCAPKGSGSTERAGPRDEPTDLSTTNHERNDQ